MLQFKGLQRIGRDLETELNWTVACKAPLSMEFPRQGYWSQLLFPSPGDFPNSGIEPGNPTLHADSYHLSRQGNPVNSSTMSDSLGPQGLYLAFMCLWLIYEASVHLQPWPLLCNPDLYSACLLITSSEMNDRHFQFNRFKTNFCFLSPSSNVLPSLFSTSVDDPSIPPNSV